MAGPETDQDDKTEAPTQRRLDKARAQGQAPVSQELAGFAGLLGGTLALALALPATAQRLAASLAGWLGTPDLALDRGFSALGAATLGNVLLLVLAVGALVAAPALVAHLLQTGFLVSAAHMKPQWSRVSPAAGLKRLVSPEALVAFLKNLLKLAVLGVVVWNVLAGDLTRLAAHTTMAPEGILHAARGPLLRVLAAVLVALAVLAVLDLLWTRLRFTRQMRMSRQDLRDEHKEAEGDPHLKAKLRRIREQRAKNRMMAEVKNASVVVTNPTHYAVALAYDRAKDAAPRVVAKGVDEVAARIRAEADKHRVPLYRNPPLARALFTVDLGRAVPADQYQAVAEVIAYVWRLKSRVGAGAGAGAGAGSAGLR
jgi:flagellar biosynthetic protein FlhB